MSDVGEMWGKKTKKPRRDNSARRAFSGNIYDKVQDPNLICPLTGHKEGSKAFNRYRKIDEDTNRKTVSLLE